VTSNGGANGILLDTTGALGGINVTGTGAAGTGGTIQNKSIGVSLNSTTNPQFAWMNLSNFSTAAIKGTTVNGGKLDHVALTGTSGTLSTAAIDFTNLTGSVTVSSSSFQGGVSDNFRVFNVGGSLNRITFSGDTFGANATATGSDSLTLQGSNGTFNVTVQNSIFTSARGDLFQLNLIGMVASDLVFTGNTLSNNHPNIVSGGGGVTIGGGGPTNNPTFTYLINNNTFRDALGAALAVVKGSGNGTFNGTISNNRVGVAGLANSGSAQGDAISVFTRGSGSHTVHVTGNNLRQYNNVGIDYIIGSHDPSGSASLNATTTGNVVTEPAPFAFAGVWLDAGTNSGDANQICFSFGGSGALANSITGSGFPDFELDQQFATTVRLPGYAGTNTNTAAVVSFVTANNGGTPSGSASVSVPPGGGFIGGAACP